MVKKNEEHDSTGVSVFSPAQHRIRKRLGKETCVNIQRLTMAALIQCTLIHEPAIDRFPVFQYPLMMCISLHSNHGHLISITQVNLQILQ